MIKTQNQENRIGFLHNILSTYYVSNKKRNLSSIDEDKELKKQRIEKGIFKFNSIK
jgi:hypothetical protein